MMRLISMLILLAFLFASTHGIVDHDAGGHKRFAFLLHGDSLPVQTSSQHAPMHADDDPETASLHPLHAEDHGADRHTHFTLAPFPRSGSTLLPLLLALTSLLWTPDTAVARIAFFDDGPLSRSPGFRPLYLHCRTLLI
jgi:hypothetical protein